MVNDPLATNGSKALIDLIKAINSLNAAGEPDFEAICGELHRALACHSIALHYDDNGRDLYAASHPALPQSLLQPLFTTLGDFAEPRVVIKDVARQRKLQALLPQLQEQQISSLALNRLHDGDRPVGALLAAFADPDALTESSLQTAQLAAAQLSLVLAQRRNARRIQTLEGERALLDILQQIAARANRAQSFEEALRFAIDHICTFTKWPLGHAFWLEDRDGLEMVSSGIWHCSLEGEITDFQSSTAAMRLAAGDSWLGELLRGGAGGWRALGDEQQDAERLQRAVDLGLLSSYTFPIRVNDRTFALLEFFMPVAEPPTSDIVQAMEFVAFQLARVVTREETQRALRHSEKMLGEAQRLANLGSWEWDVVNDHLHWSEELFRIYGLSPEQFTPDYESWLQRVHPEDRERVSAVIQQSFQNQEPFDYQHRIIRGDGIVRILHARGYPILDDQGDVVRMYGSGQDITDRHQTEEALRKSEKSYRTLARNIPDALVALYDHDLKLTLVEGSISPFGQIELPPNTSLRDVLPDAQEDESLQPFHEALQGRAQTFERTYGKHTYLLQAVPVRDESGEIFAGIAMAQDITARYQAEQKLIQRAEQMAALHKMGQAVAASLDLNVVFQRVLETLRPLVNAEGVFVLLSEGDDTLVFAAANEVGVGNLTGQRVPSTRGVAADVVRTGRLQWLQGDETVERVYHELKEVAHYHPRAIIAAPMRLHGKLIGVMEAVHSEPDAFGDEERDMMETAASWVAIAIGNARQHGLLQHRLKENEAFSKISRALSQTLDLERILNLIVDSARNLMTRADSSLFFFLRHRDDAPQLVPVAIARSDANAEQGPAPDTVSVPSRFLSIALQSTLNATVGDSRIITYEDESGAIIAVPVRGREGSAGLLTVHSASSSDFNRDDHRLLTMLGQQAAMAVENARLFRAQQEARRTADTLRAANVALSQSLERESVLDTFLAYADQLIGFDFALVLLNQRNNRLAVEAVRNLPDAAAQVMVTQDYPALETTLAQRRPHILRPGGSDNGRLLPATIDPQPGAWLLAPLISLEGPLGLLMLGSRDPAAYGEQHATLAEGLAAQAAIAIQNASLFAEIQSSQARLRILSRKVVNAQEEERQRISRELHDEAGQALTALKISLEMLRGSWPDLPDTLDEQLGEAIQMTDQTMEQIRLLAHDLRPPVLDTFGLSTSVEGLARDFGRRTGLNITIEDGSMPPITDAVAISFYRFVQETLTNVARHANATEVSIELRHDSDKIMVCVSDDGKGFDIDAMQQAPQKRSGIGLIGMQDRFELLNGWVEIKTAPGQGTSVSAYVPYREVE